jgi:hypothetical protein
MPAFCKFQWCGFSLAMERVLAQLIRAISIWMRWHKGRQYLWQLSKRLGGRAGDQVKLRGFFFLAVQVGKRFEA